MPVEFVHDVNDVKKACKLVMAYDGSGRRISKTRMMKTAADGDWYVDNVTRYTGIGTEVRETHVNGQDETKVVVKSLQGESRKNKLACSYDRTAAADAKGVHMPQGLGRYTPEDAVDGFNGVGASQRAGYRPPAKFEWYLKNHQGESSENVLVHFHCRAAECCALRHNHLGSTMLVYGTSAYSDPLNSGYKGGVKVAYDYRAFGEQVDLTEPTDKVTENFTGKGLLGECSALRYAQV
ncbi:MAG: hypothetical protein MJZ76_10105 [Bacteroidales bacterium]|nr:hypothetical protein [Bacteroidales bacterium]